MGVLIPLLLLGAAAELCFARPLPTREATNEPSVPEPSTNTNAPAATKVEPVIHPEPEKSEEVRRPVADFRLM